MNHTSLIRIFAALFSVLSFTITAYAEGDSQIFSGGTIDTQGVPQDLQLVDLDEDGLLDLVVFQRMTEADISRIEVLVAFGLEDGEFTSWDTHTILNELATGVQVGYINSDEHLDIAIAKYSGQISIFLGDGDRGFVLAHEIVAATFGSIRTIDLVDYDLDGVNELVLSIDSREKIVLIELDSQGMASGMKEISLPDTAINDVHLFDYNRDGLLDLFVSLHNLGTRVWFQNETSGFELATEVHHRELSESDSFALADLTGDGLQDFVFTVVDPPLIDSVVHVRHGISVFPGFSSLTHDFPVEAHGILRQIFITDINEDSKQDVLVAFDNQTTGGLYLQGGWDQSGYDEGKVLTSAFHRVFINSIQVGDIDLDGHNDIAVSFYRFDEKTSQTTGGVRILFNRNSCLADYNGDGQLNFFDISLFIEEFKAQRLRSDINSDDAYNYFDVSEFVLDFIQGCP